MLALLPILARGDNSAGVLIALVFFAAITVISILSRAALRDGIASLANQVGGTLLPGCFPELPEIRVAVQGRRGLITFSGGKNPMTTLVVYMPDFRGGRLSIACDTLSGQFLRLFGVRDIQIGDPSFDAAYVIQADPEALAHRVFAPEHRRSVIGAVRRLFARAGLVIRAEPGRLEVQVREFVGDAAALRGMLHAASELVTALSAPALEGLELGELLERMAGICPICTTALKEPVLRCGRCRAPHHRECWEYLGRCAVYGCEPKPGRRAA
jgi:hypothetical protein